MKRKIFELATAKKRRTLAYIRYTLPFAVCVLMLILFLLPLIYFRDYNNDLTESSSLFSRISDNISQARKTLFSNTQGVDEAYISFSKSIMTFGIASLVCMVLGLFSSITYMITGFSYLRLNANNGLRRIYVTFVPNKAILISLIALCAVPAFFPHFLVKELDRIMMIYSKVYFVAGDLLIWCTALLLIPTVFFIVTKKYDTEELNIFAHKKRRPKEEDH